MKFVLPLLLSVFIACTSLGAVPSRPNIVIVMTDDLGYNDLSCYGSEKIKTPVLDKLASEGVRLTSFYAGATVCTPSRMALLTGAPHRLPRGGHCLETRTQGEIRSRDGNVHWRRGSQPDAKPRRAPAVGRLTHTAL